MSESTIAPPEGHGPAKHGDAGAAYANAPLFPIDGQVPFDKTTPEQENTYHQYTGNAIPWFVRVIWIVFWCFAITYVILYLIPSMQSELLTPR
jgi:hypothetical protein